MQLNIPKTTHINIPPKEKHTINKKDCQGRLNKTPFSILWASPINWKPSKTFHLHCSVTTHDISHTCKHIPPPLLQPHKTSVYHTHAHKQTDKQTHTTTSSTTTENQYLIIISWAWTLHHFKWYVMTHDKYTPLKNFTCLTQCLHRNTAVQVKTSQGILLRNVLCTP